MQPKKKERKKGFEVFNSHVALPQILLETIITCKNNHMQEKLKQNTLNNVRMRREKALPFFDHQARTGCGFF